MNRWYGLLVAAYCAGLFWLSSGPAPAPKPLQFFNADKLAHAAVYGGLAFLVHRGMRRSDRNWPPRALMLIPLGFVAAYGASDEFHQYFVPTRSCDIFDWLADTLGALVVLMLLTIPQRRRAQEVAAETFSGGEG